MRKTSALLSKNIPLVEAVHYGGRQRPTAILLRTSWTTGDAGAANGIAQAWHRTDTRVDSCHYVIDEFQTIRCVPDRVEAFSGTDSYRGAISINVCHDPSEPPYPAVLYHASRQVARLCKLYRIRLNILNETEEERWLRHSWKSRGGILNKTVGNFPIDKFFVSVVDEYNTLG